MHDASLRRFHDAAPRGVAYCAIVWRNAPAIYLMDITGDIEVETDIDAICGIAVARLT
ncbi:MAG: hypothetical protein ABSG91_11020 [Syntrophobacteraceae bacterium]